MITEAVKKSSIVIGRLGENEARVIRFDVRSTQRNFPGCSFAVLNRRPNDSDAYPVNSSYVTVEGGYLLWTVMSGDVAQEGIGECEIVASVGSKIVKSEIYQTRILHAMDGAGTPPEPWESWVQDVTDAADRAEAAAEILEHPGAETTTLSPGSSATASYADGTFTFGIPRGATGSDGAPGDPGPAGVGVPSGGTTGQVLKKKSGTDYDTEWGEGGGGVQIDDTAGAGSTGVTWSANKSTTEIGKKYAKPSGGIPSTDMASAVQTSLGKADTAYQKPSGGIPSTDIASGVIPDISGKLDAPSTAGTSGQVLTSDGQGGQSWQTPSSGTITDVQVNGTTVVTSGVANVPIAGTSALGVVKPAGMGINVNSSNGELYVGNASAAQIKAGATNYFPIVPSNQHESTFFGLAKAAGADMASISDTTVGQYTDAQKIAIQKMLGIYESPWELIREDTVTNATSANIEITVDNNGNTFQLTSAILLFETPKQATQAKKEGYGAYYFYYKNTQSSLAGIGGTWTQAANADANGCSVVVESKDDLVIVTCQSYGASGNFNNTRRGYKEGFTGQTQSIQVISGFYVSSVSISSVTGTGHYKLFGKRKWTT